MDSYDEMWDELEYIQEDLDDITSYLDALTAKIDNVKNMLFHMTDYE